MMTDASFATAALPVKMRGSSITTLAEPVEYGADLIKYGSNDSCSDGDVVTNTMPEFVSINSRTDYRAYCVGWDLYKIVDGSDVFLRASTNTVVEGESFTNAIVTVDGAMKVVWHWKEQYYIAASPLAPSAASTSGGTVSGAGWYFDGESFALTATPAEGYKFVCWAGGVSLDTSDKQCSTDLTYTTGDNVAEFVAVFLPEDFDATWLYIPSDAKIVRLTGPKWIFNDVACDGTRISIPLKKVHLVPSAASALDMTGAVKDLDGNEYSFYRFTPTTSNGYDVNILGETERTDRGRKITSVIFPESITSIQSGTLSFLSACTSFDLLGKIGSVTVRQFHYATSCKWIRFHYFPPTVASTSDWTFYGCGAADYAFRIEYPSYLENAWLCATNNGARYDYKNVMTANEKKTALSAYRNVFGKDAAEPNGYATLNFIKGVANPKRKASLVSYEAPIKSGKIALGIMGLPYAVARAEAMSPSYGYHEYDTGEPIVVGAPRRFTELNGQPYYCKGYVLSTNPAVTNSYVSSFTLPGDVDANIGVTWVWKTYSGVKGMVISVR